MNPERQKTSRELWSKFSIVGQPSKSTVNSQSQRLTAKSTALAAWSMTLVA